TIRDGHISGTAIDVPWTRVAGAIVLAAKTSDRLYVGLTHTADLQIDDGHNLAGEPREGVGFDIPAERIHAVHPSAHEELVRGRAVGPVTTIAHQLHGAIGVTIEHQLWLTSLRAQSWVTEFGGTAHYAQRLGRMALATQHDEEALLNLVMGKADDSDLRGEQVG